jgi:FkbM family methyltransferase
MDVSKNPATRLFQELAAVRHFAGTGAALGYGLAIGVTLPKVLKSGKLTAPDALMERFEWTCSFQGHPVRYTSVQFGLLREILGRLVYTEDPRLRIAPSDVIVDLGSNTGVFTVAAATAATSGRVVAVEALGGFFEVLHANTKANSLTDRVTALHAVVGPRTGWFARGEALSDPHFTTPPRALSMIQLLTEQRVDAVDFLKVDIEGSEFALFEDKSEEWLPRVRRIAMEVHPDSGSPENLRRFLEQQGYDTWTARDASFLYAVRRERSA